jgi:hypothetical protein
MKAAFILYWKGSKIIHQGRSSIICPTDVGQLSHRCRTAIDGPGAHHARGFQVAPAQKNSHKNHWGTAEAVPHKVITKDILRLYVRLRTRFGGRSGRIRADVPGQDLVRDVEEQVLADIVRRIAFQDAGT